MRGPEARSGRGPRAGRSRSRRSLAATSIRWGSPARRSSTRRRRRSISMRWSATPRGRTIGFSRLSLKDGSPLPGWPVDVARGARGERPALQLARTRTSAARSPFSTAGSTCPMAGISAIAGIITAGSSGSACGIPRDVVSWRTRGARRRHLGAGRHQQRRAIAVRRDRQHLWRRPTGAMARRCSG